MTGGVSWEQFLFLCGIVATTAIVGFLAAWRIQGLRRDDRHELRSFWEQRSTALQEQIDELNTAFDTRVKAIELANAGTLVVLEHMQHFQDEVTKKFETLREERERDMQGLHKRLDAIFNNTRLQGLDNAGR